MGEARIKSLRGVAPEGPRRSNLSMDCFAHNARNDTGRPVTARSARLTDARSNDGVGRAVGQEATKQSVHDFDRSLRTKRS
jgi:hypothetical protein